MKRMLCLAFVACFTLGLSAREVVKIGVILPLSGDNAHLGEPIQELIQYKFDHLPEDRRYDYQLVFEDDQLQPKRTLLAAQRLIDLEKVDVIVTFFTAPSSVVAPLAKQKKVTCLQYNFRLDMADGEYNFIHVTTPDLLAKQWMKVVHEKGYANASFLVHRNSGGEMILNALRDNKDEETLKWIDEVRFNQGERDFRSTLEKMRQGNPELLFIYAFEPELPIILRQLREIGWDVPVTSISMFELYSNDPRLEDCWFVSYTAPTQTFTDWYLETFKRDRLPLGIATYSDWSDLIVAASESCEAKPTSEKIAAYLRQVKNYKCASGTISVDENGLFATVPSLMTIKNGRPVVLDRNYEEN